ncbi:hypothetical protein M9458_052646, partial [Cirrhinus mrigala]
GGSRGVGLLRTLRLRVAIVQGDELAQLALLRSSSAASLEPRSKVPRAFDVDLSGSGDEIAPAQYPRAPHPPDAGSLPVRFMTADLRPSPGAQDMVSFGAMEDAEEGDDAISVAASEREEWSNSPLEYTALHGSDTGDLHHGDVELLRVLTKAVKELGLVWAPPAEPTRSRLDKWYLQSDFFPNRVHNPGSSLLSSVDGADRAGYAKLPPVEEAVAAHLCPAAATNWRVRNNASLPFKPCRATANFAGKAFSAAGQAASALHVMAILQVYQAKLLKSLDEGGPDPEVFKELRRATDLALRTTKVTARAIGRSMGNLVVLDRHLWLTLTELKDSEKTALLDAPVDPSGLFGAAVETFTERFAEAQKQSRAISHFLPKRAGMNPPAQAWQMLPGVSEWIMKSIKNGYTLQFFRRPPHFNGVLMSTVREQNASILREEIHNLLGKCAVEKMPLADRESGFYSRYFLVPKKDGRLRPILDLRPLNRTLSKRPFKMITLKQILSHVRARDWFISVDLKDAYFHIQVAPRHRHFLRFAFEGIAYQFTVLPFGLSLAPQLRADCKYAKKHPGTDPEHLLPGSRARFNQYESAPDKGTRTKTGQLSLSLQVRALPSAEILSEGSRPDGCRLDSVQIGAPAYETAPALAKEPCATKCMALGLSARQSDARMLGCTDPLARYDSVSPGCSYWPSDQEENCHDGCIKHGLGSRMRRQASLRDVDRNREVLAHKLSGGPCCTPSARVLSPGHPPPSRSHQDGQYDSGSVYKSPRRCELVATDAASERPPFVGRSTPPFHPSSTCPRTLEPRCRLTVEGWGDSWRVEITPTDSEYDLECIRQGGGGPIRISREHSLPAVLFTNTISPGSGCSGSQLAESSQVCLSSSEAPASSALQNQTGQRICSVSGTEMAQPAVVPRIGGDADSPPVDYPAEEGPPLSSAVYDMAPEPRVLEPSCLAARQCPPVTDALPQRVLDTISEARAPSTRRPYAHKWRVFTNWCESRGEDPFGCPIPIILAFLQEQFDSGRMPSTLKVYVAAIAAFHALVDNRIIGKNDLVIRFLKGARRLNPPRPSTLPTWDLALVLDALTGPPFEPIQSVSLRALSLKTALLLALASVKRVGDLQALSIDDSCIEFGPGHNTIRNIPPETSAEPGTPDTLLCPVRTVRTYTERSREFRLSDQLFVCFGGRTKGLPVSKQRLSHWIVDAIALAYSSKGVECPIGVCAFSTRGLASSWAWANGISIQDICTAASWSSPSTFARFYNLDVSSLASHVLSVRTAQAAHPFT